MLLDGNATVVANACASLSEISRASGKNYLRIKSEPIFKFRLKKSFRARD
jgi:hypothetical protein